MSISSNIIEGQSPSQGQSMAEYKAGQRKRRPTHPGAVLASSLSALSLTPYAAAPLLGVTRMTLGNVIAEKSAVSPEMALRLGKFFGNGPELWLGLQADHDIWTVREKIKVELSKIKTVTWPDREDIS